MGNICYCLCPKRHNISRTAYDIHEQTFEMQQKIGSMNIDDTSPTQQQKSADLCQSQQIRESSQSLDEKSHHHKENQASLYTKIQQNKYIKEKNKHHKLLKHEEQSIQMNEEQMGSSKDIHQKELLIIQENSSTLSSVFINQPKEQMVQIQSTKDEQKKAHPNILKPKTVKKKYNPDDYRFKDQSDSFKVKKIDSIKCQQYNIQNCSQSEFYIFDITANVYIDDTNDCKIYIAPCESTIFVRNCKNLIIIASTKQFRTYLCHNCTFSLICKSQPVIESSSNLVFMPFQINGYAQFRKQINTVKLQIWNNHWSQIHNFTKNQGQVHYTLKKNFSETEVFNWQKAFQQAQISELDENYVPFIQGELHLQQLQQKQTFIVLFNKDVSKDDALILESIQNLNILKSFKGKISGFGKDQKVALLLGYKKQEIIDKGKFQERGQVFIEKGEVQKYSSQFFVNFGDERQK